MNTPNNRAMYGRLSRRGFIGGTIATAMSLANTLHASTVMAASPAISLSRGDTSKPVVALTFDAGSDRGYASSILDTLNANGILATFGVTGAWAVDNAELVRRFVDEGHDIMNHTYSHPSFTGVSTTVTALTTQERLQQVESTEQALINACGRGARPLFRPPYGDYDQGVLQFLGDNRFTHSIMWSVDVLGWQGLTKSQVISRALSNHGNGYIYLMHLGGGSQEGPALPEIIAGLRNLGYGFVSISQMINGTSTPPVESTPFSIGDTVRVTAGLYLRTAPNLRGQVITTMPTDTICTVVGGPSPADGYTWYQVTTTAGTGWAAGEFLQLTASPPSSTTGYAAGTKVRVTDGLWLRSAPNLNGKVIVTMPTGTVCTILSGPNPSGGYTWYELDTPWGRGWAAGEYLEKTTQTPPATTGYAAGTRLIATSPLNLRTSGSLNGSVRATMSTGTACTVISGPVSANGYTWYELDTPYGRGWAASEFLKPAPSTPSGHAAGTRLRVTAGLWLRTAPNLRGTVLTTMPTGTVCTVVSGPQPADGYTWYQLDTPYGRGWAAGEYLTPV